MSTWEGRRSGTAETQSLRGGGGKRSVAGRGRRGEVEAGDERPKEDGSKERGNERELVVYGPATPLQERKRSRSLWSLADSWPVSAAALDRQARDLSQERRSLSLTSRCEHPRRGHLTVNSRCGERKLVFDSCVVPISPSNSSLSLSFSPGEIESNLSRTSRGCREIERRYI